MSLSKWKDQNMVFPYIGSYILVLGDKIHTVTLAQPKCTHVHGEGDLHER